MPEYIETSEGTKILFSDEELIEHGRELVRRTCAGLGMPYEQLFVNAHMPRHVHVQSFNAGKVSPGYPVVVVATVSCCGTFRVGKATQDKVTCTIYDAVVGTRCYESYVGPEDVARVMKDSVTEALRRYNGG